MDMMKHAKRMKRQADEAEPLLPERTLECFNVCIGKLNTMINPYDLQYLQYHDYIKSTVWKTRRRLYIEYFDGVCQLCHKKRKPLSLHHNTYVRLGREEIGDLILICTTCHGVTHNKRGNDKNARNND